MSSAREEILSAVRGNLSGQRVGGDPPAPPDVPLLGNHDLDAPARVAAFRDRLEAVGGKMYVVLDAAQAAAVIGGIIAESQARAIAWSDASRLAALRQSVDVPDDAVELPDDAPIEALLECDLGITAAQWGVAETGSLVLESDRERHRLRSLLPPVHVAVLPQSRILCTLGEVLKTLPRPLPRTATFITGPSRTADIELNLVIGVHGPRELHVVLIPG